MILLSRLRDRLDRLLLNPRDPAVDDRGHPVRHVHVWAAFPDACHLTFRPPDPPDADAGQAVDPAAEPDVDLPPAGSPRPAGPPRRS